MNRYTVIGSAGFIGSHVVARLRHLGNKPLCLGRDDIEMLEGDLGNIIYCAGLTGDYRTRPFDAIEAHVSKLARLIQGGSFERLVYLSSTRLYDLLPDGVGKEDRAIPVDPYNPEHLYELSKMLGESLALHRTDGRGVVARVSYVFGWGGNAQGFLSHWLRAAADCSSLTIDSTPTLARDYIHVEDVASALVTLADTDPAGIINVARGETISNNEIAAQFRERGWTIEFARESVNAEHAILIDPAKLQALGATARPVLPLIGDYLTTLS